MTLLEWEYNDTNIEGHKQHKETYITIALQLNCQY